MNVIRAGKSVWSPKDSTLALTSPNDVHHSVNLSKLTRNLLLIFTPHFITFSEKKILKHLYLNTLKMSNQTFPPDVFADELVRQFTQTKIIILRQRI